MNKREITLFFPVYNDAGTVRCVAEKALAFLKQVSDTYEIIIVDDGSPDESGKIADQLAQEHSCIRVVHHPKNLGYGAALKTAFGISKYNIICFTDGDNE